MKPTDPALQMIAKASHTRPSHCYHVWHALASQKKAFNAAAFAMFCDLETKHIVAIVRAFMEHDLLPGTRSRAANDGGTRLPADFQMPPEWIEWACNERGWTQQESLSESGSFVDYWHAEKGPKATKLDWHATWRVWVRNSRRKGSGMKVMTLVPSRNSHDAELGRIHSAYERGELSFDAYMAQKASLLRVG
jgi:hypothetical protein